MGLLGYYDDPDALSLRERFRDENAGPYAPPSNIPGTDASVPPVPVLTTGATGRDVSGPALSILPPGLQPPQGQTSFTPPQWPQTAQDQYQAMAPAAGLTQAQFNDRFYAGADGANPAGILQIGMSGMANANDASRFEGQQFDPQTYAPSGGSPSWQQNVSSEAVASPASALDRKYTDMMKGARFEGFTPKAKWDVRQWTNGYGTKAAGPNEVIDRDTAEQRFQRKIKEVAAHVDRFKPDLPPGVRAALIDLTFNAGSNWMKSGLGEFVRSGDYEKARERFLEYNKVWNKKTGELEVNPHQVERRTVGASWFPDQAPPPRVNPIPFINMRQSAAAQRGLIDFSKLRDALQASGSRAIFLGR